MRIIAIEINKAAVLRFEPWRDAVRDFIPQPAGRESPCLIAHAREARGNLVRVVWHVDRIHVTVRGQGEAHGRDVETAAGRRPHGGHGAGNRGRKRGAPRARDHAEGGHGSEARRQECQHEHPFQHDIETVPAAATRHGITHFGWICYRGRAT